MMISIRQSVAGRLLPAALAVVCFMAFPGHAQTPSDGNARVIQLTGQVSALKDSGPWALQSGSVVSIRQLIVTGPDGFAVFQVSDGSTFEVFPNSRVTFRNNPSNWKDLLDVWLGRVKVHIEKIGGQPNYNRIRTPTAVISVRGTTFDVAVEGEESTLVSVEEGQVLVSHALIPMKEPKVLNQGDSLRVYRDQPLARANPNKDVLIQRGLNAVAEALYRIVYRPTTAGGSGSPVPSTGGGGQPLPGDTNNPSPPPAPGSTPPPPAP
ncbi:MAG: FecR domain-containing protein [Bryobacteraceae bacterium]|nr:FecR domain-containing protein [Bryobacteraceae bacterium]